MQQGSPPRHSGILVAYTLQLTANSAETKSQPVVEAKDRQSQFPVYHCCPNTFCAHTPTCIFIVITCFNSKMIRSTVMEVIRHAELIV